MMAMMAAGAPLVTAAGVILGFSPVRGHTGACLLSRLELFSPAGQSQQ
jgi:proteasome assembly chaperone (PAC2) family protein